MRNLDFVSRQKGTKDPLGTGTMRSGFGLCVLGLVCLHNLVSGQVESGVRIFCDDQSVAQAVHSAVTKFNQGVTVGHKMALYQILSATKAESGADTVYSLKFNTRKSDCLAGSEKPWTDCNYHPENEEPIPCNATVHMMESEAEISSVDCFPEDPMVSERASCLGCPIPIDVKSEDLKSPLSFSVHNFNSNSNHTHHFKLNRVVHATRQVVAGFRFKLRFDVQKTKCAKVEHPDLHDLCELDQENEEFSNCNATVDVAPWRHEVPQVSLHCETGQLQRIARRRPPGWSPLRNVSRPALAPPSTAAPTTAVPKEQSSEEDTTGSATSATLTVNLFNCPSKPWKVFNATGTAAPPAGPSQATAAGGTFSDVDLLGN